MSGLDVSGRPQILFIQNLELPSGVGLVDVAGLDGGLPVRLIIGQEQIPELHAHGEDVGFELANRTADRKGMLVDALRLEQELVSLHPRHDSEGNDKQQDDAQTEAQLRADFQIAKFHGETFVIRKTAAGGSTARSSLCSDTMALSTSPVTKYPPDDTAWQILSRIRRLAS